MADVIFGHDGRGTYNGIALYDSVELLTIPFTSILKTDSPIAPQNLAGTN
ncbi:hypothetical protein KNT64_gp140 [Pseudomonas phage PspYZU05]|uniref:Uncharacterized protein n=1 Tax=Pseudomonas phage PspYZU05 TaxID=1983556 RepID=A0A2U7NS10_9CAUD|nr:hypothetical protein KNT64_gp140 [Pseudomonas phage PspYZU05]ASD52092.1 hypothetical protein PspYZU05_140 [Pseudomonas phage PspYZU05]